MYERRLDLYEGTGIETVPDITSTRIKAFFFLQLKINQIRCVDILTFEQLHMSM